MLNGQPAAVGFRSGRAQVAILLSVADGKTQHVFLQADPERLRHLAAVRSGDNP